MSTTDDWEAQVRAEHNAIRECDRRNFVYGHNLHRSWFLFLLDQKVQHEGWGPVLHLLDDADEGLKLEIAGLIWWVDTPRSLDTLRALSTSENSATARSASIQIRDLEHALSAGSLGARSPADAPPKTLLRDAVTEPEVPRDILITPLVEALTTAAYDFYGLVMNGGLDDAMDTADALLVANAYAAYIVLGLTEGAHVVAAGRALIGDGDIISSPGTNADWKRLNDRFSAALDHNNALERAMTAYLLSAPGGRVRQTVPTPNA